MKGRSPRRSCAGSVGAPWVSFACLGMLVTGSALAQTPQQPKSTLYGYKLTSSVNTLLKLHGDGTKTVCLPAHTTLTVISATETDYRVEVSSGKDVGACTFPRGSEANVLANVAYVLTKSDEENSGFARRGATYGALVVPFKYQLKVDKQFTSGSSLGGYAGYRFESLNKLGITATPIVFFGAAGVPVKNETTDDTKTLLGVTYGFGLVGTFQNSFQTGLVLGWDRVGKNDGYKYNGKPWIAVQIGFAFLQ